MVCYGRLQFRGDVRPDFLNYFLSCYLLLLALISSYLITQKFPNSISGLGTEEFPDDKPTQPPLQAGDQPLVLVSIRSIDHIVLPGSVQLAMKFEYLPVQQGYFIR